MGHAIDRRDFLRLAGLGGVVFASGLAGCASYGAAKQRDFHFVQLSDSHWGFSGPAVNPETGTTLKRAVAAVNALAQPPDFIVFAGDLIHTTDDPQLRRTRMREFQATIADLKVRTDIIPGQIARLRLVPERTGIFTFLCDVFCGDGHEGMNGQLTVVA